MKCDWRHLCLRANSYATSYARFSIKRFIFEYKSKSLVTRAQRSFRELNAFTDIRLSVNDGDVTSTESMYWSAYFLCSTQFWPSERFREPTNCSYIFCINYYDFNSTERSLNIHFV